MPRQAPVRPMAATANSMMGGHKEARLEFFLLINIFTFFGFGLNMALSINQTSKLSLIRELVMNIVTILGGPRKKGSTALMLGIMEDHFRQAGHAVDRINITEFDVKGCISCYKCRKSSDEPGCSQKDDAMSIFERMMRADVIVYSTPLYCWSWAAQIKPLIDRHYCLVKDYGSKNHRSFIQKSKSGLLMTCGGPVENNADLLVKAYDYLMDYCNIKNPVNLVIPFCASPDSITDEHKDKARQLAQSLIA